MVKHKRAVACPVGMAAVAGGTARGDEVFWISEFSESWHNGFNWSTGSPPAPGDAAFIEVAQDIVVTHSQGATLVDALSCDERFRLIGASSLGFSSLGRFSDLLTIETTGGLFTQLASSEINLFGPTNYNAGEIGGAGSVINGGMMTIGGNGEKTISAVFENNSLGSMNLQQGTLLTFDLNGGAFVNRGQFDQHGDIILINGQIDNLDGGVYGVVTVTLPSIHGMGNAVFNNAGSFFCSSGTQASLCDMFFNNTGSVEISPDGQVSFNDVLFDNSGVIDIQAGGMMISGCIQVPVTNSGAVHVAGTLGLTGKAPTLYVQTAGSTVLDLGTIMAEGAVDIQGGEVAGIGSINGELLLGCGDAAGANSAGFVALADPRPSPLCPDCTGLIEVFGDFTQCELGELEIAFYEPVGGEAGEGSVHDRLAVSAVATLGGKLTVTLNGPFDPPIDVVFEILTAEAINGVFSEVQVPILPGNRTFEVIYNLNALNTVQLKVVAVDTCPADFDHSGAVDVKDLLFLLGAWGPCPKKGDCPADFDNTGAVDVKDLLFLLGAWGPC